MRQRRVKENRSRFNMGVNLKYIKKHLFIFILCAGLCLWSGNLLTLTVGDSAASMKTSIDENKPVSLLWQNPQEDKDAASGTSALPEPVAFMLLGTGLVGLACFSRKNPENR
jgi:hypothetical protein